MNVIGAMNTPFSPPQLQAIESLAREKGYEFRCIPSDAPADAVRDCAVLVGYFPKRLLKNARELKWLHLPSAGADRYVSDDLYDGQEFTLTNSSGAFGTAIAEQLIMGTLMLLRNMPVYARQQREKIWQRTGDLRFLRNASVTVLGTGNLGGTFCRFLKAMGASVTGVNRSGGPGEGPFDEIFPISQLHRAVSGADVVATCLPLTRETEKLLDEGFFAAMKPGSIFLNVGRGKTVEQEALIRALQQGHLSGAMLDVAEEEPMPKDCPLWDMENVIITPHISGSDLDPENTELIFSIFMDNLSRYFEGKPLQNVVDRNKGY